MEIENRFLISAFLVDFNKGGLAKEVELEK